MAEVATTHSTPRLLWQARGRYRRVIGTVREVQQAAWRHRDRLRDAPESARTSLHADIASALAELFRQNGGAWIKFGQFLSCRPDLLPEPYIKAFSELRDHAPAAPFGEVQGWLQQLLGDNWTAHFSAFNIIPVASASIAQVHHACLTSGKEVAVKLQLPRVREEFSQDKAALMTLVRLLAPVVREIDIRQVADQLIRTTEKELDFTLEAESLKHFAALPHIQGIRVPALVPELCSTHLLVTEWMPGPSLSQVLATNPQQARPLLEKLLASTMQQVLEFGFFHSDPHPGNFIISPDGDLVVLDLGAVQQITNEERAHYLALLMALLGESEEPLLPLFQAAGFGGLDEDSLDALSNALVSAREDKDASLVDNLRGLLEQFRKLRLTIPDAFVAMVRVLITVGGLMSRYEIPFQWPFKIEEN